MRTVMIENWLTTTWTEVWLIALSALVMVAFLIATIRIVGLRSLSKMSSFDFAVTVALGSVLATVVVSSTSLANGALAIAALLAVQAMVSIGRQRWKLSRLVDNRPLMLMRDGRFHDDALRVGRVTHDDVRAKLREANVTDLAQVLAVVLETTGDVSVLHGDGPLDEMMLEEVRVLNGGRTPFRRVS